ncbi:MAG: 50S ribosomal protein L11 [Planctomycetota bacterium]|jgi:large subunit ribosomal protein L11|nr:50S ribosomal protein L11 [Planctomycetota bacterium]MDA0920175.1 50S ribosomal protein L11 [Planctomycetota bacterium]
MAKQVTAQIKVQIPGGKATPAPPVGTALGPHGVNIGQFVQGFNDRTRDLNGTIVPVVITVYNDRSFDFDVRSPPAAVLLKQYAQIAKGASNPRTDRVGSVTKGQILEIVRLKKDDLNTKDEAQACRIIEGTARSMGVEVTG